jgi:hypothetical protein
LTSDLVHNDVALENTGHRKGRFEGVIYDEENEVVFFFAKKALPFDCNFFFLIVSLLFASQSLPSKKQS